jgi:hypothetical protein
LFGIANNTAVALTAGARTIRFIAILPTVDASRFRDIVKSGKQLPGQFAANSVSRGLDPSVPVQRYCGSYLSKAPNNKPLRGKTKAVINSRTPNARAT